LKKFLQIDGGGILGVIAAVILYRIEKELKTPINKIFHAGTGSSVGTVICGASSISVPAEDILRFLVHNGKQLFSARSQLLPWNWFRPKYSRDTFLKFFKTIIDPKIKLSDVEMDLIFTAFNLCSDRTHFIKNTDDKDSEYSLLEVISWSALSAALYFGKIPSENFVWIDYESPDRPTKLGGVFQDGGQGIWNCTLQVALNEVLAKYPEEEVYILSLGSGFSAQNRTFKEACSISYLKEIFLYLFQARKESTVSQVSFGDYVTKYNKNITVRRLDAKLPKKMNKLDAVRYISEFEKIGLELFYKLTKEDFEILKTGK
jgi:patatin-like phospholipase/acyl hydrolase